jgi:hypothetical protein
MTQEEAVQGDRPDSQHRATNPPADERRDHIGWARAVGTGVAIMACSFVAVVWVPDLILRQLTSVGRDLRVLVAATVSIVAVVLAAFALRRLQSRGVI